MMTLTKLIHTAPFDEETRKELLGKLDSLSEDQKRLITELAWTMLATNQEALYASKTDAALQEIYSGKVSYSPMMLDAIQEEVDLEFSKREEQADAAMQIKQVKQDIANQQLSVPQ